MSNFKKCSTCGEYHFTYETCKDEFIVIDEDHTGEKGMKVRGWNHEEAAKKYAEIYNSDGDLMGNIREITVEKNGFEINGPKKRKFNISAEPSIHYSVNEIPDVQESTTS